MYPAAAKIIKHEFYVDNVLAAEKFVRDGAKLCKDVLSLLGSFLFNLRKWHSNQPAISQSVPSHLHDKRYGHQYNIDYENSRFDLATGVGSG